MQNILDWYNGKEETPDQNIDKIEFESNGEEKEKLLNDEYQSCLRLIGMGELLINSLSVYLKIAQDQDLDKKDKMKEQIKIISQELLNSIMEL